MLLFSLTQTFAAADAASHSLGASILPLFGSVSRPHYSLSEDLNRMFRCRFRSYKPVMLFNLFALQCPIVKRQLIYLADERAQIPISIDLTHDQIEIATQPSRILR